ncbi:CRAL/TRIO domain-containing protein [Echria macrotheca]|uniref:Phosphatidylinositol transfer protein SFH5 n=1 Tax=Echria macrotheca TaxID=438768 RepID=A0AAJ0B6X3_9PEZI|nr:CRAL/TRIO domain-containing protein [Echria macrotheca]
MTETAPEQTPASDTPAVPPKAEEVTETPLATLWQSAQGVGHPEIWGVTLQNPNDHVPSQIIFQKFLNANDGDIAKAKEQLLKTLEWRKKTNPLNLLTKLYSKAKFEGLGYVTTYGNGDDREIFTWNIYGGVKSISETFGNVEEFIEWRAALMELALKELNIAAATVPITADDDPYKIIQVHDYKSLSFLRSPPEVKATSREVINLFSLVYPELLKEKFFVNVPAVMGFVYAFMKLFVAAKTIKKFHPMSNGGNLALEFGDSKVKGLGELLPPEYGGKGAELKVQGQELPLE